jgi:polyphosphate kinase 2 (PPK2 family)
MCDGVAHSKSADRSAHSKALRANKTGFFCDKWSIRMTKKKEREKNYKQDGRLKNKFYESELERLQIELVKLQEWVKVKGLKVVVLFEGRDAAGKGGVIKRITQSLNPRIAHIVALGTPT